MIVIVQSAVGEQRPVLSRGRPSLSISESTLSSFLEQEFTQVEIACSAKSVHQLIVKFGLSKFVQYSSISDSELDALVELPHCWAENSGWSSECHGLSHTALQGQGESVSGRPLGGGAKEQAASSSSEVQSSWAEAH